MIMFNYYFGLALRSLKRNVVLTALMIAAIGVGIGASMTTLTVFRAMGSDPIPQKSRQLFAAADRQLGAEASIGRTGDKEHLQPQIELHRRHGADACAHAGRTGRPPCTRRGSR